MARMKGNMKRVGTDIPGANEFHEPPPSERGNYDRLAGNETTYYDGQLRPGPRFRKPGKRGKRISKMRTANDAAMALSGCMEKKAVSSGAGYAGKSPMRWFKGVGYT